MKEKEARAILKPHTGKDYAKRFTPKEYDQELFHTAGGYLEAVEKANRLADGVRYALTKGNSGDAEKALAEWEKEK